MYTLRSLGHFLPTESPLKIFFGRRWSDFFNFFILELETSIFYIYQKKAFQKLWEMLLIFSKKLFSFLRLSFSIFWFLNFFVTFSSSLPHIIFEITQEPLCIKSSNCPGDRSLKLGFHWELPWNNVICYLKMIFYFMLFYNRNVLNLCYFKFTVS